MASNAPVTQFREEFIAGFEQRQSLLRDAVTTEAVIKGNQATFLVADSGGATATTRGVNGMIPARSDNLTQTTATLAEKHDLVRKTGFNIFESQGDQRRIMQMTTMGTINRTIDQDIIGQLDTATNQTSNTASIASVNMVMHAVAALGNNEVPFDGNVWGLITPGFLAYLMQTEEFNNADYVQRKPYDSGGEWKDQPGFYQWANVKWIVHPNLTGAGTSSEKCYVFHRSALGHAVDIQGMKLGLGYDDEQDYSYCRYSCYFGSKMLQQSGVIQMLHDGSAFATV